VVEFLITTDRRHQELRAEVKLQLNEWNHLCGIVNVESQIVQLFVNSVEKANRQFQRFLIPRRVSMGSFQLVAGRPIAQPFQFTSNKGRLMLAKNTFWNDRRFNGVIGKVI
jgi:hypothetical protein